MKIILLHNQSLIDISVQVTGKADNALLVALENGFKIHDEIPAGTKLTFNNTELVYDKDIQNYYTVNEIKPASALTQLQKDEIIGCEGIECWAIEKDFIVQP